MRRCQLSEGVSVCACGVPCVFSFLCGGSGLRGAYYSLIIRFVGKGGIDKLAHCDWPIMI
jgi:hypothetical protein